MLGKKLHCDITIEWSQIFKVVHLIVLHAVFYLQFHIKTHVSYIIFQRQDSHSHLYKHGSKESSKKNIS